MKKHTCKNPIIFNPEVKFEVRVPITNEVLVFIENGLSATLTRKLGQDFISHIPESDFKIWITALRNKVLIDFESQFYDPETQRVFHTYSTIMQGLSNDYLKEVDQLVGLTFQQLILKAIDSVSDTYIEVYRIQCEIQKQEETATRFKYRFSIPL